MDKRVKKAGNNYIVEAGHLIGEAGKLDEDERKRTRDIQLKFVRTIQYNFSVAIPTGYSFKEIENFNKNIKNDVGNLHRYCFRRQSEFYGKKNLK